MEHVGEVAQHSHSTGDHLNSPVLKTLWTLDNCRFWQAPVPRYLNVVRVVESEDDHEVDDAADVENGHVEDEGGLETLDDAHGEGVGEGATEVPHQYGDCQEDQPYLNVSYEMYYAIEYYWNIHIIKNLIWKYIKYTLYIYLLKDIVTV